MKNISQLNLFRAFASRNYTLYFFGRAVSQFGTWMQRTAVVWVVYSATHSAFLLGVTIFAEQFPSFICSVPGGVAADRYSRYTIIKITQVASMLQAVLLAVGAAEDADVEIAEVVGRQARHGLGGLDERAVVAEQLAVGRKEREAIVAW